MKYTSQTGNNRVRKVLTNGTIQTIAGTGDTTYNGDGIPATTATLNSPYGLFVDEHSIYIADYSKARIRRIDSSGIISTVVGTDTEGFSGDVPFDIQRYPHVGPHGK